MKHQHRQALNLLKTAKGQIDAVIKMTEDERYCVEISNQIMASIALLKKANLDILKNHLETCVRKSFEEGNEVEKIDEVIDVLKVYLK
jgi:CsoR family transcriptional regulator, copper-sensing transcriptional repressor